MYSGYYCRKCKLIPLIKANITEKNDIKIILKCKCHCNYLNTKEINKNYIIPTNKNFYYSFEKNYVGPKKSNSRNISFLKESKKQLNKKIPIYTKESNKKEKFTIFISE